MCLQERGNELAASHENDWCWQCKVFSWELFKTTLKNFFECVFQRLEHNVLNIKGVTL